MTIFEMFFCQAKDYHLSYHFASEGGDLTTTTAAPVFLINSKRVFLSKLTSVVLSMLVPPCLFYICHLYQAGGCPENWQELEITQDSGEVSHLAPSIPSIISLSSTLTNPSPPIYHLSSSLSLSFIRTLERCLINSIIILNPDQPFSSHLFIIILQHVIL